MTRPRPVPLVLSLALVLAITLITAQPARAQQSRNITLLSHMDKYSTAGYSSCWSYIHSDGREYAVEFSKSGASFVRLTDPEHPVEVGFINLPDSDWHEGRQYQNFFYVITEFVNNATAGGLTVIDMTDPDNPRKVANYNSPLYWAHTIEIDTARGFLYAPGGTAKLEPGVGVQGLIIFSLADPRNPTIIGVYGNEFPDYCHTIHVRGTRGYASMQILGTVHILDLTDPAHPVKIAEIDTPGGLDKNGDPLQARTTHSSWTSQDERYLYVSDEKSIVGLYVFDIQNLANIQRVYSFEGMPARTIAHDPVVRGNLLFSSYYSAGARVYDISNPAWPVEIGFYDTYPGRDGGFVGNWEVAPLFPSGIFIASDIQTGLYVFRLTGTYGIVRGTVRNGPNGPALSGAVVSQSPTGPSTISFRDGRYSLAVPSTGSATLNVTLFGFDPLSKSVSVSAGNDKTLDLALRPSDAGVLSGVIRNATGTGLNGAEIEIMGTPLRAMSSGGGVYSFPSVPAGSYTVRCIRPGHAPRSLQATVAKAKTTTLNFSLTAALTYFDVETDQGWSLADMHDDATRGIWVRAVPIGTFPFHQGTIYQTDKDRTPDPGAACFVTGNAPTEPCPPERDCSLNDALFGDATTTLTSPDFHFTGVSDPRIGYWRWFMNYIFEIDPANPLVTEISGDGGGTWITVETLHEADPVWNYVEIPVASYIPQPTDVRIRFIASTRRGQSWVEAAVDDISGYSGTGSGSGSLAASIASTPSAAATIGRPFPSPTQGAASLELRMARAAQVRAELYDVRGRLVRTLQDGVMPAGLHTFRWDGRGVGGAPAAAGVYWLKIEAAGVERVSRLVVIR